MFFLNLNIAEHIWLATEWQNTFLKKNEEYYNLNQGLDKLNEKIILVKTLRYFRN